MRESSAAEEEEESAKREEEWEGGRAAGCEGQMLVATEEGRRLTGMRRQLTGQVA